MSLLPLAALPPTFPSTCDGNGPQCGWGGHDGHGHGHDHGHRGTSGESRPLFPLVVTSPLHCGHRNLNGDVTLAATAAGEPAAVSSPFQCGHYCNGGGDELRRRRLHVMAMAVMPLPSRAAAGNDVRRRQMKFVAASSPILANLPCYSK